MTIIRNGKEIKWTYDEIYKAHKEFVSTWMINTAKEIIQPQYHSDITENDYIDIGEAAYDTYAEGNGLTEYEAVEDAVEKFLSERNWIS